MIGRQVVTYVVALLVASLIIFMLVNLLPGDVAGTILGTNADAQSIAELRRRLGLDRPWPLRYLDWMGGLVTGNLGTSALSGVSVAAMITPKLAVTGWLVLLGMTLSIVIAIPVGVISALRRRRLDGLLVAGMSQVGMAVPAFLAGLLLSVLFAVKLHWLPANGYTKLTADPVEWARHMVLPVVSLAIVQSAVLGRYVRSAFIDVLNEDHFRTARSIGWPFRAAVARHGLRNAALQVITVLGLELASLFAGGIVVENVFVLPGMGSLLVSTVNQRDLPVVQGIVMLQVALVLVINGLADLAYRLLDPRLRDPDQERTL
ncbi:Putative glutathione ABC transporter, permease protein GsiC [Propionibacterium freudenreichii]|uniref:ABC transporter permease n=1 Tax=Propionibacterium freudenreichii TaxID=1744 RepID=UPI000BC328A2|nr:ABC transporter permease [Propionibacterium freudenreichii]MDK9349928.1 ABC transporter permease [Propionibacterium freudenreichii]MDK9654126.1 ABC transporter permease [Propionibacterium freudenreichii]SBN40988.1 Putative glutathione ABC transporter, permease protein GsiC [Propionibacterium freudenreichii]SCQ56340.1 Putative glutathione ABC transporter, permease protein GsiC [Propionibacterium freudenreichii]SCQ62924.1 Putative glutathione ABC transporter, permease protein GsiC [Propioniba